MYSLRDHLGNTRVVFSDLDADGALDFSPNSPEIVQTNTYYPFGMLINGMHPIDQAAPSQPYRYNGKELTLMGGLYDYGFRYYDPSIGRFVGVDPIAEKFPHVNVYNYAENEPVGHIDLWGLQKYKPKMQSIDKPSDLLSTKMLNNLWEGMKTAGREFFSKDVGEGIKNVSEKVELIGIGVSMSGLPEFGLPIAAVGSTGEILGNAIIVTDELIEGNLSKETSLDVGIDVFFDILPKPAEKLVERANLDEGTKALIKSQTEGTSFTKTEDILKGHINGLNEGIKEVVNSKVQISKMNNEKFQEGCKN